MSRRSAEFLSTPRGEASLTPFAPAARYAALPGDEEPLLEASGVVHGTFAEIKM